jgi:hypothetical protein
VRNGDEPVNQQNQAEKAEAERYTADCDINNDRKPGKLLVSQATGNVGNV